MPFLVALVVLVGAVCLVDLVLTLGVIRRLREHSDLISRVSSVAGAGGQLMLAPETTAAAFETVTVDGEPLTNERILGPTLFGAFMAHCPACEEGLPDFVALARNFPGGRAQVLALVVGAAEETGDIRAALDPVARVVAESTPGTLARALNVRGFPAMAILDDAGLVVASGSRADALPVPAGR